MNQISTIDQAQLVDAAATTTPSTTSPSTATAANEPAPGGDTQLLRAARSGGDPTGPAGSDQPLQPAEAQQATVHASTWRGLNSGCQNFELVLASVGNPGGQVELTLRLRLPGDLAVPLLAAADRAVDDLHQRIRGRAKASTEFATWSAADRRFNQMRMKVANLKEQRQQAQAALDALLAPSGAEIDDGEFVTLSYSVNDSSGQVEYLEFEILPRLREIERDAARAVHVRTIAIAAEEYQTCRAEVDAETATLAGLCSDVPAAAAFNRLVTLGQVHALISSPFVVNHAADQIGAALLGGPVPELAFRIDHAEMQPVAIPGWFSGAQMHHAPVTNRELKRKGA
jgi:hypothetical protein